MSVFLINLTSKLQVNSEISSFPGRSYHLPCLDILIARSSRMSAKRLSGRLL